MRPPKPTGEGGRPWQRGWGEDRGFDSVRCHALTVAEIGVVVHVLVLEDGSLGDGKETSTCT